MANPTIFVAALGGILPALLWLAFWLLEDRCQPEPKRYIFFTFLGGMAMVFVAMIFERQGMSLLGLIAPPNADSPLQTIASFSFLVGLVEESLKFIAAYLLALRWAVFDEPLDGVIYLVTAALGFSALENSLFLYSSITHGQQLGTIIAGGDLRFIGAMLLHSLSSASIGVALAVTYNQSAAIRRMAALGGVILAVALHTLFDFLIISTGGTPHDATFWVFLFIWFGIVAALLMVERVKQPARDYC